MIKANQQDGKLNFRFNTLKVTSKTPTLLSLEELLQVEEEEQQDSSEEEIPSAQQAKFELTPIATSFHSGCLVHAPYNQFIIVGGCFDEDDDEYLGEEFTTNEVMAFDYMESKWKLLFGRSLSDDNEEESTLREEISNINISSDEQDLNRPPSANVVSTNSTKNRADIPPRIWGHSCTFSPLTRCIYIFGGIDYEDNYNYHLFSFSLERREWKKIDAHKDSSLEELPSGRQGHRTLYIPSLHKILLFGGFSNSHLDDFYEFDVRTNTWSKVEEDSDFLMNRPSCREVFSMTYAENRNSIIIFGGKIEDERYSDLREFSLTTKKWTVLYHGKIKICKQTNSSIKKSTNKTKVKHLLKDEPSERSSHSVIYLENYQKIILLSGYDGEEWFSDCYEYDFNTMQWSAIILETDDLPDADEEFFTNGFSSHVAEFNNITNEMLVFGGWDGQDDSNILFSIKIPSYHSVVMRFKLLKMNDLFSDVTIHCINDEH